MSTVPVRPVADMLRELYDAGWTIATIQQHGGPSPAQQWRIVNRKVERVRRSTFIPIADLYESLEHKNVRVDSRPLIQRILHHHQGELASVLEESDRRQFYRAKDQGWLDFFTADRWCVQYLGLNINELYPGEAA